LLNASGNTVMRFDENRWTVADAVTTNFRNSDLNLIGQRVTTHTGEVSFTLSNNDGSLRQVTEQQFDGAMRQYLNSHGVGAASYLPQSTVFDDTGNLMPGVIAAAASWSDQLNAVKQRLIAQGLDESSAVRTVEAFNERIRDDAFEMFIVAQAPPVQVVAVGWVPEVPSARQVVDNIETRIADGSIKGQEINQAIRDAYKAYLELGGIAERSSTAPTLDQQLAARRLIGLIGDLGQIAQTEGTTLGASEQNLVRLARAFEAQRSFPEIYGVAAGGGALSQRRALNITRPTGQMGGRPIGDPEAVQENALSEQKRGIKLQNEAAEILANAGFKVEHLPIK
jgi:hypothetical protein